jgi:hypothetical protein
MTVLNNDMKTYLKSLFEDKVNEALDNISEVKDSIYIYPVYIQSFVFSVFPVPAGPPKEHPSFIFKEAVIVNQTLSVNGVITTLGFGPIYSYP